MRKVTAIFVIVLTVAAAGIVYVAASWISPDSPTEVVQQMVDALEHHDGRSLRPTFCDPDLAELMLTAAQPGGRFRNVQTEQIDSAESGSGLVQVTGEIEIFGSGESEAFRWLVWLEKAGRKWCIVNLDTAPH